MTTDENKLRVLEVHAFWQADRPEGFSVSLQFEGPGGIVFCRQLQRSLPAYEAFRPEQLVSVIAVCKVKHSVDETSLTKDEIAHVIGCIHSLERRGFVENDEYNGVMFHVVYDGSVVASEKNPILIDFERTLSEGGKGVVDVTDILRASKSPLDGGTLESIKTVVDHERNKR